jgi:hypothetical protein
VFLAASAFGCVGDDAKLTPATATPDGGGPPAGNGAVALANSGFESGAAACGPGWSAGAGAAETVSIAKSGTYGCEICVTALDSGEPEGGAARLYSSPTPVSKGKYLATAFVHVSASGPGATNAFVDLEVAKPEERYASQRSALGEPTEKWLSRSVELEAVDGDEMQLVLTMKGPVGACAVFDDVALLGQ